MAESFLKSNLVNKMSTFNQEKQKLEKLFNKITDQARTLKEKDVEALIFNFFKQELNNQIVIHDTGWLTKNTNIDESTTLFPDSGQSTVAAVHYEKNIQLPNFLQPYIEPLFFIQPPVNCACVAYEENENSFFQDSYIEVYADGGLVYRGSLAAMTNGQNLVNDAQVANGDAPHIKKVWNMLIEWTDPNTLDDWTIFGEVVGLTLEENTQTCERSGVGTITIKDSFLTRCNSTAHLGYHKINDLTDSTFDAEGQYNNQSFTSGEPLCETDSVTTENVLRSGSFGEGDEFYFVIRGNAFNITDSVFGGFSDYNIAYSTITDKSLTYIGNRVYYSSNYRFIFSIDDFLSQPSDAHLRFTEGSSESGDLEFSNITLIRNPDSYPNITATRYRRIRELFPSVSSNFSGGLIQNATCVYKLGTPTAPQMGWYKYTVDANTILHVPSALLIDKEDTVITQVDHWTPSMITSYARTSNTMGTKATGGKVAPTLQFKYRILFVVKNPLQIQEIRKYGTPK